MGLSNYTKRNIGGLDARLDSFPIQLSSSKVEALDGVYNLIISTGGTGADALLETKGLINKLCCRDAEHKDLPTDHVAYIAFDTDKNTLQKVSSEEMGGATLNDQEGEFVLMRVPRNAFLLPVNSVPSYIRSWLDCSIDYNLRGCVGAGGIRQCGRLLLFENIEQVCNTILSTINCLVTGRNVDALNIYLLTSVAGGTGSGTFLDLAYIVRKVAEEIKPDVVTMYGMYGYLFLPDVNLSRPMPPDHVLYIKQNGYAALKELDYLMNMNQERGRFTQRYSEHFLVDTERTPFDFVHLISSSGMQTQVHREPYKQCLRTAAQSIASFVAEPPPHDTALHLAAMFAPPSRPKRNYIALGASSYELPTNPILLYVISLLFEKMEPMLLRAPSQKEINTAYQMIGLKPKGLMASLWTQHANIVPPGTKWEELFGRSPCYNASALCTKWIKDTASNIRARADAFKKDFTETFSAKTRLWFMDPAHGPIWLNHALMNDSRENQGIITLMYSDFQRANSQIAQLRTDCATMAQRLMAMEQDAKGIAFWKKAAFTAEYIDMVNKYADMNVQIVVLEKMQEIYKSCRDVIIEQNNRFFEIAAEVLEALKDICVWNADFLTAVPWNQKAPFFNGQPLRIPDISDVIKRAFDRKGNAEEMSASFCQALYEAASEWSDGNADVQTFLRDYLAANLSDVVGLSLEDYMRESLQGGDIRQAVTQTLAPQMTQNAQPLMLLTFNAPSGDLFHSVSVPYDCPTLYEAFQTYRAATVPVSEHFQIQTSRIRTRIFQQSMLSGLPLYSYAPLADYEQVYLNPNGDAGKHLYMGPDENWVDLPSPIPYRSRPSVEGAYPPEIRCQEDELRELYAKCRAFPVIRCEDSATQIVYTLHIAALPCDLDERFDPAGMRNGQGEYDKDQIREAYHTLGSWLQDGIPNLGNGTSYCVTKCTMPQYGEPDQCEKDAQECFIRQYNNVRRARKELNKYILIQDKYNVIQELYEQINAET